MKKNAAGQYVNFIMLSTTDGSAVTTGSPTVLVSINGGVQATGVGSSSHLGNGSWIYPPTQAETNGDQLSYTMVLSGAYNCQRNFESHYHESINVVNSGVQNASKLIPHDTNI